MGSIWVQKRRRQEPEFFSSSAAERRSPVRLALQYAPGVMLPICTSWPVDQYFQQSLLGLRFHEERRGRQQPLEGRGPAAKPPDA